MPHLYETPIHILTIRKIHKTKMRYFFKKLRIYNGFQTESKLNYAFFTLFVWKFSLEKASFCWISLSTDHEVPTSYKASQNGIQLNAYSATTTNVFRKQILKKTSLLHNTTNKNQHNSNKKKIVKIWKNHYLVKS